MNQRAISPSPSLALAQTNAPFSHLPKAGNSYGVNPSNFARPTSTVHKSSSHSLQIASCTTDNATVKGSVSLMETGDEDMYRSPRSGRKCATPVEKESVIRASTPTLSPLTIQSSSFVGSEDDKVKRDLNL